MLKRLKEGDINPETKTAYTADEIKVNNDFFEAVQAEMKEYMEGKGMDEVNKAVQSKIEELDSTYKQKYQDLYDGFIAQGTALTNIKSGLSHNVKQGDAKVDAIKVLTDNIIANNEQAIKQFLASKQPNAQITLKTAANITTSNTPTLNGSWTGNEMLSFRVTDFAPKRYEREYVFDFADRQQVNEVEQFMTWEEEGTEEGAFAVVTEGSVKPLVQNKIVRYKSEAKKIAGKMVVSLEFEKFRKELYSKIKDLFNQKLLRDYQAVLTTQIAAAASSYAGTELDGTIVTPTDFHAFGAVCSQLETLGFTPNILLIHPQSKWRAILSTGTDNHFNLASIPVVGADGVMRLLDMVVVSSPKVTAGDAIIGEANLWKIIEEPVNLHLCYGVDVTTGTVSSTTVVTAVSSDVDNNRMRLIGEFFYHSFIPGNYAGSFVKFTIDTVKSALEV